MYFIHHTVARTSSYMHARTQLLYMICKHVVNTITSLRLLVTENFVNAVDNQKKKTVQINNNTTATTARTRSVPVLPYNLSPTSVVMLVCMHAMLSLLSLLNHFLRTFTGVIGHCKHLKNQSTPGDRWKLDQSVMTVISYRA